MLMPPKTLWDLPIEVRLHIYHIIFAGETVRANAFHYPQEDGKQGHISLQPQSPLLNIFYTCRQFHEEAILVFYKVVKFRFERHSTDEINWSMIEIKAAFPSYRQKTPDRTLASTRELVRYIYYAGNDQKVIRDIGSMFPRLNCFEFDLDWDHYPGDQTSWDRAMKYAIRNREWRHAVKDALEQRFPEGMVHAIFEQQKQMSRGFQVLLHWRLAYRFIEFVGNCDLDDWVLKVRDPEGNSKNIYDIRQDPLFYEMS